MKARIIKKLSKKLKRQLPEMFKDSWVDKEVMDDSYDQGSRVSHCLMIGGELDYWGEGTEYCNCLLHFKDSVVWILELPVYPEGHEFEDHPNTDKLKRFTGKYLLELARTVKD